MARVYCLTGMHRSGTSLISSYLKKCGIPMGDNLMADGVGNEWGHYEDTEFLEFQKQLLKNNHTYTYLPKRTIVVDDNSKSVAKEMVNKRCKQYPVWGWKDPRSTLFLDMWAECDPSIRFIFMYRDPREVVDSLCRRLRKFKSPLIYLMPWLGSIAWLRYNKRILEFYNKYPESSILVSINGFINNPEKASRIIGEWLSIDVMKPFSDVYYSGGMDGGNKLNRTIIFDQYKNTIIAFYADHMSKIQGELDAYATIPSSGV